MAGKGTIGASDGSLTVKRSSTTGTTADFVSGGNAEEGSNGDTTAKRLDLAANTGISLASSHNDVKAVGTDTTKSGPNGINKD